MPLKQSLRLKQQLGLTHQLQEAIRLMQMSAIELQAHIETLAESNPLIEVEFKESERDYSSRLRIQNSNYSESSHRSAEELDEDIEPSLRDFLIDQLNQQPLSEKEEIIGLTLIDAINADGYLIQNFSEIISELVGQGLVVDEDEIFSVLLLIQTFDPVGVGSRDLAECLILQLKRKSNKTPGRIYAEKILNQDLNLFLQKDNKKLLIQSGLKQNEFEKGLALIKTLNPRPGSNYNLPKHSIVAPDVVVYNKNGRWEVELNEALIPQVKINQSVLALLMKKNDEVHRRYRSERVKEVKWLMNSIENRYQTLKSVAQEIINYQQAFLEHGAIALRPLNRQTIAQAIDKHESTVSRVCAHKTILTPLGLYEFKYFFSSQVKTDQGSTVSSKALCTLIQKLIAEENSAKPYSDNALMHIIKAQGFNLARRTVAKYRESLGLSASIDRKVI